MKSNISEIRAEVLLNHLYSQQTENWIVREKGTFYRNYSDDILELDEKSSTVSISRDGILRLLPQGLISTEEELKGNNFAARYKDFNLRKSVLEELFVPFDSIRFRNSIRQEKKLAELLENKLNVLLKTYYNVDIEEEENPYVRTLMRLLPQVSSLRGDFLRIGDVLEVLFHNRVSTHVLSQPMVIYIVWIPNLTHQLYMDMKKQITCLSNFITEWFIPFDTQCIIEIKTEKSSSLNNNMLLNYNTRIR